jgi:putative FmdB family regulatory protein
MEVRKMPIYEYACEKCDKQMEVIQKITEAPLTVCPDCKGRLRKMVSSTSFVLKGTGWYVTDYASNNKSTAKTSEPKKQKDTTSAPAATATPPKEPAAAGK